MSVRLANRRLQRRHEHDVQGALSLEITERADLFMKVLLSDGVTESWVMYPHTALFMVTFRAFLPGDTAEQGL
jgi:hypothetical protein